MRIVCDTNVLISGLIWSGIPGRIWDRVESGADRLSVSRPMLAEMDRVLTYPRIAQTLARRELQAADLLRAVVSAADVVWPRPLASPVVLDDPDDDAVLACAAAGNADYIVTGDQHLLSLGSWDGIRITAPAEYIRAVNFGG